MEWPTVRQETALVCVDFMNLFLARYDTFQGPCYNLHTILQACHDLGRTVARDPLVTVYLDTVVFNDKNPDLWPKFRRSCEELDILVYDVVSEGGVDQVDPVIIEDMLHVNAHPNGKIPFLLVSADKGFMPMVAEVRRRRKVYVGLPINACISALAKASDGWRWIHPTGWEVMAMKDVFVSGRIFPSASSRYVRAYKTTHMLLSRLRPGQQGRSWVELFPRESSRDPAYDLMENDRRLYLEALVFYGVLAKSFLGYRVLAHDLVGRPVPAL